MFKSIWFPITLLTLLTIFSGCQKEPTASFTVSSTSIEVGESVSFTNTSADADSYEWNFGDGSTSSSVSPTYTYNTAGTYTVTLTAFSKNGKKNDKAAGVITVKIQVQTGTLTDDRDGQIYNTVKIGNQWWMAENLNIGTIINSSNDQTDNDTIEKYCYNNDEANCDIYGGLYQWDEMMQYSPSDTGTIGTTQGVCPTGWHLPTDAEWKDLIDYLGGSGVAGGKLKEKGTAHWNPPNTGATNESGFTALPGGCFSEPPSFYQLGTIAFFWTATEFDSSWVWARTMYYDLTEAYLSPLYKSDDFSVRCVKD